MVSFRRLYPYRDAEAARSQYEIWADRQVLAFARDLEEDAYRRFRLVLTKTADEGKFVNEHIYKHVGEGIYEFKHKTVRIYSFDDGRRVVLTHGGKHKDRVADARKKAAQIRKQYYEQQGREK